MGQKQKSSGANRAATNLPAAALGEFDRCATRLGLTEQQYASSAELRQWCEENLDRCYIPEWLLKKWDIDPDS
jgi:hypothetical protein